MSSQTANKYEVPIWRVLIIYAIIVGAVGLIISKLINIQVLAPQPLINQSVDNYTNEISDPAARGIIYDRNGYVLARNVASYNVVITPAGLPDDDADIQRIYREVSKLIDVPVNNGDVEYAKLFSA